MSKREYDEAFKSGAVKLTQESDKPGTQIAKELGIRPSLLYSWLKKARQPEEVKTAMAHLRIQESEIKRLKKELKRTQEERDILKKATAYFARGQQ